MNYIVLNDQEYYQNIQIDRFKEVRKDGNRRVDAVFGTITTEILEQSNNDEGRRNQFFGEEWLCRDPGVRFVVIKVPQDILYDESGQSLEKCFGLFDPKRFWLEMGSIRIEDKENSYEYFLVAYNKNSQNFSIIFDEIVTLKKEDILNYICKKIEIKVL